MKIILASKSPMRKKLLLEMGLKFEVVPANIDEEKFQDKTPSLRVQKIARAKAVGVLKRLSHEGDRGNKGNEGIIIIAADTLVYLPTTNNQQPTAKFIGKPKSLKQAKEILTLLSGSTHWLYTGICVLYTSPSRSPFGHLEGGHQKIFLDYDKTKVFFRKLSPEEINSYIKNPEVLNHAGTYTIEKSTPGEGFIKKMEGSYSNVLGLPSEKLRKILSNLSNLGELGDLEKNQLLSSSLYK